MRSDHNYVGKTLIFWLLLGGLYVTAGAEQSHYIYNTITIDYDGHSSIELTNFKIHFANDINLKQYSSVPFPFPEKGILKEVSVTANKNGKKVKLKSKDATLISGGYDYIFIQDRKIGIWNLGIISPGDEIESRFLVENDDPDLCRFIAVSHEVKVDTFIVQITYPAEKWRLRYSVDNATPRYADYSGLMTFVWTNVSAVTKTQLEKIPRGYERGLWYSFESLDGKEDLSTWSDVSQWAINKFSDVAQLSDPSIITPIADAPDKIVSAIVEKCHYVAIEIGEGKRVPSDPDDVWAKGYGDCKGLGNLFVSWMKATGHEAWPVLVLADSVDVGNFDFPTPYTFNHVIAGYIAESGDTAYQDLTAEFTPLGYLPIEEYGCFALPLISGATPLRLGFYPKEPDTIRFVIEGELADNGALNGKLNFIIRGQKALRWNWLDKQNKKNDTEEIKDYLTDEIPKSIIRNIITDSLNSGDTFHLTAEFNIDKFALPKESSVVVKPWIFGLLDNNIKIDTNLTWPTFLRRNLVYEIEFRVRVGQGSYIPQDADSWKNEYSGLISRLVNNSHDDSLITKYDIYLPPITLSPEQYISYNRDRKQLLKSVQAGILFKH